MRKDFFSGDIDHSIEENFKIKLLDIQKANPFPKKPVRSLKSDKLKRMKKKKKDKYKEKFNTYY